MEKNRTDILSVETCIGRQPIFDREKNTRAYEILYRALGEPASTAYTDEHITTLQLISNTIFNTDQEAFRGRLFINYSKRAVLDKIPFVFSPGSVVKIRDSKVMGEDLILHLKALRDVDYIIAVDDFSGSSTNDALYSIADIFVVDFHNSAENLPVLIQKAQEHRGTVMAKRIDSNKQFECAKGFGVDLFQGGFFHEPEIVPGKRLNSSECSRLNLLEFIKEDIPDFCELAEAIQVDPALTHRVLFYINSPYFGVATKVTSVRHAITLLGWAKIKSLLYLVVLTDASSPLSNELFIASATRAMFLKIVSEAYPENSPPSEDLFLMGLLSLLDVIFKVPMVEALSNIALDSAISNMLLKKEGDLYCWLQLSMAFESGDWGQASCVIKILNLDLVKVSKGYFEALQWVNTYYGNILK